jgi:hypothetical protein
LASKRKQENYRRKNKRDGGSKNNRKEERIKDRKGIGIKENV